MVTFTANDYRLNAKVNRWAESNSGRNCKNWNFRVKMFFEEANISEEDNRNYGHYLKEHIFSYFYDKFKSNWESDVNRDSSRNGNGGNKLRHYKTFKRDYNVETYVKCLMPRAHRRALSKFRCGVAPIRVETGRYERLPVPERICFLCKTCVEDELHVLLICPLYSELRHKYHDNLRDNGINMHEKPPKTQFSFILIDANEKLIRLSAKYCYEVLTHRRNALYK